jgi:multiple sugar transport system permease protein
MITPSLHTRPTGASAPIRHSSARRRAATALLYGVCCLCAVVLAFPVVWMATGAFKSTQELISGTPSILPRHWTGDNFSQVWATFDFNLYFWNSTWLALVRAGIPALTSALCGYVLAKIAFRGRGVIFIGVLVTMMLPGAITLIPSYILMFHFGWIGTYWPLIVPGAFSPFGTFLMRQLMMSLPDETLDAGRVDGASELALFWRIAFRSMLPGVAAVFILTFIGAWDDFVWPLMVLNDSSMYTLPVGLGFFSLQHFDLLGPLMAGSLLATIPVVIVFFLGQRVIVESGLFAGLRL